MVTRRKRHQQIRDQDLSAWVDEETEEWSTFTLWAAKDYTEEDWRAYRSIIQEFGMLWPTLDGVTGETIIARKMQGMPNLKKNSIEYGYPYSLALHLSALREFEEGGLRKLTKNPTTGRWMWESSPARPRAKVTEIR